MAEDTTQKTGKQAWKKINALKLRLTPENYHVWYAYYEGKSPDIAHAIDMLEKRDGGFTDKDIQNVYNRYIDDRRKDNAVQKAGSQVYDTVIDLSTKIDNVNNANLERGERLSLVSETISGRDTTGELKEILNVVVDDTKEILRDNQLLAKELNRSKQAMATLQQDLENIKKEAATDSLTGLLNRKAFDDLLSETAKQANESKVPFSLLMVDIDHFKNFNDTYGHQVGDQVLRLVASTLKSSVKGGDIVARYGGEEFGLILPKTSKENALKVAEQLRTNVSSKDIVNRSTGKVLGQIKMSAGVAEYKQNESLDDVLNRADKALYSAKNKGRDQVVVASDNLK